jgi:hypothetical protein
MIVIAEGYATARSIYEATGLFVIAAMSACNMKAVALKIHDLFPEEIRSVMVFLQFHGVSSAAISGMKCKTSTISG